MGTIHLETQGQVKPFQLPGPGQFAIDCYDLLGFIDHNQNAITTMPIQLSPGLIGFLQTVPPF
jgi:hypothetical protein